MNRHAITFIIFLLVLGPFGKLFAAAESVQLTDVIKSNGTGNIDLFKDTTAANLEMLRLDNGGDLVFAVDVNEAADGSEKASSQGITIGSAWLLFTIGGVDYQYTAFSTTTQTLVAAQGSTNRTLYYTMVGDTGSNRITPSTTSDIVASFDATLSFPVDRDISAATQATLVIYLLDTNVSLGDPEAFYDYSNGFEDIAIVTAADAAYLDDLAAGVASAPLVLPAETYFSDGGGKAYYPSLTGYYMAAYEDLFPNRGDYDFNDLVVGYRVYTDLDTDGNVIAIGGEGYLVARGSDYSHDWHLRIGLPPSASGSGSYSVYTPAGETLMPGYPESINLLGDIDIVPFADTRNLWTDVDATTGSEYFVNTDWRRPLLQGHKFTFHVSLDSPLAIGALDTPPFDPYLYVRNTSYEIHLQGKTPVLSGSRNVQDGLTEFTDDNGYPFASIFPEEWQLPSEYNDLGEAYPDYLEFIFSGRTAQTDWHSRPAANWTRPVNPGHWKW